MIFYLPCKLGEEFTSLKYCGWIDGERIYKEDNKLVLKGVHNSLFDVTVAAVDCYNRIILLSYGEWIREYNSCYMIYVEDKYFEYSKLSEWGFPSDKKGTLIGIKMSEGYEVAEFCVKPSYEHIYFAIKDFQYNTLRQRDRRLFPQQL